MSPAGRNNLRGIHAQVGIGPAAVSRFFSPETKRPPIAAPGCQKAEQVSCREVAPPSAPPLGVCQLGPAPNNRGRRCIHEAIRSLCAIVAVVAAASLTEVSSAGQMPQRRPSRLLHWSNRNWKPDHVFVGPRAAQFVRQMSERLARASALCARGRGSLRRSAGPEPQATAHEPAPRRDAAS